MLLFNDNKYNAKTLESYSSKSSAQKITTKQKPLKSIIKKRKQKKLTKSNKEFLKSLAFTLKGK